MIQYHGEKMDLFTHKETVGHRMIHIELQKPHLMLHIWIHQNRDINMDIKE